MGWAQGARVAVEGMNGHWAVTEVGRRAPTLTDGPRTHTPPLRTVLPIFSELSFVEALHECGRVLPIRKRCTPPLRFVKRKRTPHPDP